MSQILENKQMVHIVSEVIVLIGLTFYFNQKNKKLLNHIEDLAQRIEEQEDLLQKHENIIKKLVASINEIHGNNSVVSNIKNVSQESSKKYKAVSQKHAPPKSLPPKSLPPQSLPPQSLPPQSLPQEQGIKRLFSSFQNFNLEKVSQDDLDANLEQNLQKITEDTLIMEDLDDDNSENDDNSEDLDSAIPEELNELIKLDTEDLSLKKQQ